MLAAFDARSIKELGARDRSKQECILTYGDKLLVGLNNGMLRIYRAPPPPGKKSSTTTTTESSTVKLECLRELENFSKRAITQFDSLLDEGLLVVLADGYVSLHDVNTYERTEQIAVTKGATVFACDSGMERDSSGVPVKVSRLAVVIKRKLVSWKWQDGERMEPKEVMLSAQARCLSWIGNGKLCGALSSNFVMVDVDAEKVDEMTAGDTTANTSTAGGYLSWGTRAPMVNKIGDDISTYASITGETIDKPPMNWTNAPEYLGFSYPYLVSLQPKSIVEVRNAQTQSVLQTFTLANASYIHIPQTKGPDIDNSFYVLSPTQIWRLDGIQIDNQINELSNEGLHDEAISILEQLDDASIDFKSDKLKEIRMLKAEKLFEGGKYRKSMELFAEVSAPPERVIRLYPVQIAGDLSRYKVDAVADGEGSTKATENDRRRSSGSDPKVNGSAASTRSKSPTPEAPKQEQPKPPEGKAFKASAQELSSYLADMRRRLSKFVKPDTDVDSYPEFEEQSVPTFGNSNDSESTLTSDATEIASLLPNRDAVGPRAQIQQLYRMAQLVDTTLLRTYMLTNTSLVKHFVRIENFCDPKVVQEKLIETGRFRELIDYLWNKKLYKDALILLKELGDRPEPDEREPELHGTKTTVEFLQKLTSEDFPLILEFCGWILRKDSQLGMQIFTDDTEQSESLPRSEVLKFLEKISMSLGVQYMEHVIYELKDDTPEFHNWLIGGYLDLMTEKDGEDAPSEWEWKMKKEDRDAMAVKLFEFLISSTQYWPEKALNWLPRDDPQFYESRAAVLSKMGQHKQALEIFVYKLKDHEKAEDYCNRIHLSESPQAASTDSTHDTTDSVYHTLLSLYLRPAPPNEQQIEPALTLLSLHGARLNPDAALKLLPESLKIRDLNEYFTHRMRQTNEEVRMSRIMVALRKTELLRWNEGLIDAKGRYVEISEERVCPVCHKRLGKTIHAVLPVSGQVVHYGCVNAGNEGGGGGGGAGGGRKRVLGLDRGRRGVL